ncbi:putative hydrolase [Pichia kluyveri]|uniref:Hydrolase n=1 Tax=Pichia kluyveri TaxID=36015 RepID=A0AAV5R097_PICKL|nr:putative hydrolase [Pichia kluyveri]
MRVAAAQICSTNDLLANGLKVASLIRKAANDNIKLIFFPEASDYIASSTEESIAIAKPINSSPFIKPIIDTLKELQSIDVVVGVHVPSISNPNKTINTLLYFNKFGEITEKYEKLHLFDVDIPNGPILKESNSVIAGNKILPPFDTPVGKLGLAICYDLRFPELSLKLRSLNAQILTFPSAWTIKTGPHFHKLAQACAIYTQCYVILPAQGGEHNEKRKSFGHTCIIDPNGEIVAEINEEGYCVGEIDLQLLNNIRTAMPLWNHKRWDVYGDK